MKLAPLLLLGSLALGQQTQENDFHFSKVVAISISAESGLAARLLSVLSNRLRRIDGVIVNNMVDKPDYTIEIAAFEPSNLPNVVAASYIVTSQVFDSARNQQLTACAESSLAGLPKETTRSWLKAAVYIDFGGVATAGAQNLESLADQIVSSVDANVIQRSRDTEFILWKALQRAPAEPAQKPPK